MKLTKKKFEEHLNKKSKTMKGREFIHARNLTYPLTGANIRSNIRGNFGTLLRRHNPDVFNKRYRTEIIKLIMEQDPYHSNIKLAPGLIKMLAEYEKLRAKGLTHREVADKLEKKMF